MAKKPTLDHLNRCLHRGEQRALELEERMVEVLIPILEEAGRQAAASFRRHATNHLTAAALREMALTAAVPGVTSASTMICVKPRPEEAAALAPLSADPVENLHCTLVYLGETEGPLRDIAAALAGVAGQHAPLIGEVSGYGEFGTQDGAGVGILLPDVPGLVELRVAVTEALVTAGIDYARNHGFEAHLTLAYDPEEGLRDDVLEQAYGLPLHFDEILVVRGDTEIEPVPLVGVPAATASALTAAAGRKFCLPAELRTRTDPVRTAVVETMMKTSLEGVGIRFDVTNPFAGRALAQTGQKITEISRTTQLDVMRVIRAAYDEGLSIPDTAKAITTYMKEAAPARARLIARTELAGAVNGGSLASMHIVSRELGVDYYKQWMTAGGAKHPRHNNYVGLDGQTQRLDHGFDVGGSNLQHPGDPFGPPGEVCNCRCAMRYTDDADALLASAGQPPIHGLPLRDVERELETIVEYLTAAAGRADWTAPAPSEVLNVDCAAPSVIERERISLDLTTEEIQAVADYTGYGSMGQGYVSINRYLRGQYKTRGTKLDQIRSRVDLLDEAIAKSPPTQSSMTVWRAFANPPDVEVGSTLEDSAFVSTSATSELPESWAGPFGDIYEIEVPPGAHALDLATAGADAHAPGERELLFPRGTKIIVESYTDRPNPYSTLPAGIRRVGRIIKARIVLP